MTGSRRGLGLLIGALVLAVVVGLVLRSRVEPALPFQADSASPDGWKAVRLLLEDRGVDVRQVDPATLIDGTTRVAAGEAVVVPVPAVIGEAALARLDEQVVDGGVVVFGEPPPTGDEDAEFLFTSLDAAASLSVRTLVDEPPNAVDPGNCTIDELADLGDLDVAFSPPLFDPGAPPAGREQCYSGFDGAFIHRSTVGAGQVVTLASPFLWTNARLQPNKEEGGGPLANGAVAVRLLGNLERVTFVDPVRAPDAPVTGTQDPLSLMPLPVKLALAQLLGAVVVFLLWRGRRLGAPVAERLPVEIAGSELVVAVGDLLRRQGSPGRAAEQLRAETRRVLAERLGTGPQPPPAALVELVATRSGRPPAEVGAAIYGEPSAPVTSAEQLVRLAATLDQIRTEVLHVVTP